MVAAFVLDDCHGLEGVGDSSVVKVILSFKQSVDGPVMSISRFTFMLFVEAQPLLSVNLIVVLPSAFPVTVPLVETVPETVAMPVLEENHGALEFGVPVAVSVMVLFTHKVLSPVIFGSAFTVTCSVSLQELASVNMMSTSPAPMPVT